MTLPALVLLLVTLLDAGWCEIPGNPGPLTEVSAVEGGRAVLPCDVTPPTPGDAPILVLFYNGATGTPIYSIDARAGPLTRSIHWSDLKNRAHFDVTSEPQGLVIDELRPTDDGDYRCRVDFRASPTRNLRVKLLVIVPPRRVSITNANGLEVSGVIGPYPVGKSLSLTCEVQGGKPRPQVSWWHEGSLLDDVVEVNRGDVTRNTLTLPNLTRQHLYRVLTCHTSNSNMSQPLAATVTLDMSYPPIEVNVMGNNSPLSEGERYALVCEAFGSRPHASLTWWMEGVLMKDTKDQILQEGNVSRSTLHLTPTRSNDGNIVSCRAENPLLDGAAMEDSRKLIVYYAPKLVLRAGLNLNMSNIKEGEDVYFECDIQANPKVFRVQWFQNGQELHHNVTAGVILSNQSLVLQGVTRSSSGLYTCRAINMHGEASSNAVQLSVKYAPVCAGDQKWVYGGGRHQPVNVTCRVESHPEATEFRWAFNTSSEYVEIPQDRVYTSRGRSMVAYTPQTHHDFGSLLCWGVNDVEAQYQPCVFHIVPAAVPEAVHNCSVWHNASAAGEVVVACEPGWGGGLTQTFTLEVRQGGPSHGVASRVLAALKDQPEPHFTVTGLAPGTEYRLAVVASNSQGSAPPSVLVHLTPIDVAEKRTSPTAADADAATFLSLTPILAVLMGVVASLVVCSVILVVVMKVRSSNARARANTQTKIIYDKASPSPKTCDEGGFVQQERGPDIILVKSDLKSPGEDKQLVRDFLRARDGSFYINPGSLLNNGAAVKRETEALLQDPTTTSTGFRAGVVVPRVCSSVTSQLLPPGASPGASTDSLARSSYCSGRSSPPATSSSVSSNSPRGSTSTVALHPDYCPQDPNVDPATTPLVAPEPAQIMRAPIVTSLHASSRESSV